jgi:hypothetical protein
MECRTHTIRVSLPMLSEVMTQLILQFDLPSGDAFIRKRRVNLD